MTVETLQPDSLPAERRLSMASLASNKKSSGETYVPDGAATEGRAPDFSVDDMLSQEFKETFDNVDCLSIGEVAGILHEDVKKRKNNDSRSNVVENVIFSQTQEYVFMFSNITQPETKGSELDDLKESLRGLRFEGSEHLRLTNPEIAMLCSLVPEDYEEAITLVPSLRDRFERGQVESIIDKLEQKMQAMS